MNKGEIVATSPCIHQQTVLGNFAATASDVGQTITFASPALTRFLNSDTNGRVTFVITRVLPVASSASGVTSFASTEHPTLAPPQLSWSNPDIALPDYAEGATVEDDGSMRYQGRLQLEVFGGGHITLPNADVVMTFGEDGKLETLQGTVGDPELPAMGLFSGLSGLSSSGTYFSIGYDYPANFDTLGLPLPPSTRYFFLVAQTGASVEWGPFSLSSPDSGNTLIAIDPAAPTVFFYTDHIPFEAPLDHLAVGVAGDVAIPFTPWYDDGVAEHLHGMYGNVYLGGSVNIPMGQLPVEAVVTGELVCQADTSKFATNQNWMKRVGANGTLGLSAGLGPFSLGLDLAGASARYGKSGGHESFAFSGELEPDDVLYLVMPLAPRGSAHVAGYFSTRNGGGDDFVEMTGAYRWGESFVKQTFDGTVRFTRTHGTYHGKAHFAGVSVDVTGTVHEDYATFSGKVSHGFNSPMGRVKSKITAAFDTRNASVSLSATARLCAPSYAGGSCGSIGVDEVTVTGSGHIRICVQVPMVGNICSTF